MTEPAMTRDEMVGLVRAMGPAMKERAVKYDLEASFPFENFADFRGQRAARRERARALRRPRCHLRRLRAGQRGGRPALWRHRPHVQHAQRDDAVVRRGGRPARHDRRRSANDTRRPAPRCIAASSSAATSTASRSRRAWRRARPPVWPPRPCRSTAAGWSPVARSSRRCPARRRSTTSPARCPARTRSACSACRAMARACRSSTTGIRSACAAPCRARC